MRPWSTIVPAGLREVEEHREQVARLRE